MKLYSPKFTNPQLQDCFYTLYNSEVDCASAIFLEVKDKHKHHTKGMAKFAKNFLLDSLELNEKTRCVFAWSGNFVFAFFKDFTLRKNFRRFLRVFFFEMYDASARYTDNVMILAMTLMITLLE